MKKLSEGGEKAVDHCVIRFGRNLRVWLAELRCLLPGIDPMYAKKEHAPI